ncbi:fatty-acyl-CoA synthase [Mycolicibacterium anyangense]|uniref:Fatty-acyl-CoA synthase n=1 Tax=Mycolicibacterium anyangense TaxID=1431246 RepID=A0A6N4WDN4_9MYCO|nr:AMP-binding protein [Mycolicibacterium anyangense]BBZ77301.1 fatty-acyl-CoA synthase [Mycolicibacterium anyangense]
MHFADIWESIAAAVPESPAVIQGSRVLTWREYEQRAARFAGLLSAHGIGLNSKVGLLLHNCPEYLEAQFGAFKTRAVPINVNYRYQADELAQLLDNADAEALVYHSSLAARVKPALDRLPKLRLLVEVEANATGAGNGHTSLPGALDYESALSNATAQPIIERSEDDLYMLYTGGTTGLPKGVMYDIGDMARSFLRGGTGTYHHEPVTDPSQAALCALTIHGEQRPTRTFACPPLMHGAGMWMGAITPHLFGATVVLNDSHGFDGESFIQVVEDHQVAIAVIVGDAFGRPIVDALDRHAERADQPDLSSLSMILSSGAMLSDDVKDRLLHHLPEVAVADVLGSTEGSMGGAVLRKGQSSASARFRLRRGVRVLRDDGSEIPPGSNEIGTVAIASTMVPRGYYKDPERSARTFPVIDGVRHSVPGDMATVEADGSIHLIGRGNNCINTGGEKVYPEEVEQAIKAHPGVADSLVFGVADERFGQRVVAVVELTEHASQTTDDAIVAVVRERLSGYKVPRQICRVPHVPRTPSGKADYNAARQLFATAVESR